MFMFFTRHAAGLAGCFALIVIAAVLTARASTLNFRKLPTVTHYDLNFVVDPSGGSLKAEARMTVQNGTAESFSEIPFLMYRLLEARNVTDGDGTRIPFDQDVVRFADIRTLQVNVVRLHLAKPLGPGASRDLAISYEGSILGYPEVMAYVKDRISDDYSLLRPDSLAYPMLANPERASWFESYGIEAPFTYQVSATVPNPFKVACGGSLLEVAKLGERSKYTFRSKVPTWRIDVAIAKFTELLDETSGIKVFVLPQDEGRAGEVLKAAGRAFSLFSNFYGSLEENKGYTVIEIPEGWGSQASDFYLLQSAAAFKDAENLGELYHEIGHSWNAMAKPAVQRSRWFDEAFASYFSAVAIREFEGKDAFERVMQTARIRFRERVSRDKRNFATPITDYARTELGTNSYTKGAWSLYVLNELIGEEDFRKVVRVFINEFRNNPAGFDEFRRIAESVSQKDLNLYFSEWFTGTESSRLLVEEGSLKEIVARYQAIPE